ncbi:MAG: hypothetical protein ACUZ9M_00650 [Candidatus Scalindua sp.]
MTIRGRYSPKTGKKIGETSNWVIEEANAADVTANRAKVAGDLIIRHKTSGTKMELEA